MYNTYMYVYNNFKKWYEFQWNSTNLLKKIFEVAGGGYVLIIANNEFDKKENKILGKR